MLLEDHAIRHDHHRRPAASAHGVDFVLAHLSDANALIDISGRSQFMGRLSGGSKDLSLVPLLQAYATANLAPSHRRAVEQAIDRIQFEAGKLPRERSEVTAWLQAHPA